MTDTARTFPSNWLIAQDYNPNDHLMSLKGKEYLDVQNRLLWFIRDQRTLIAAGLAVTSYVVRTDCVAHDEQAKWANYRTYVRDVLGNESTMEGSEAAKDFPDYAEKASTKSLGRALLCLGYGAGMAPEMDEGERVVDSPVRRPEPRPQSQQPQQPQRPPFVARPQPTQPAPSAPRPASVTPESVAPRGGLAADGRPAETLVGDAEIAALRQDCERAGVLWRHVVLYIPERYGGRVIKQLTLGEWQQLRNLVRTTPQVFAETDAATADVAPAARGA